MIWVNFEWEEDKNSLTHSQRQYDTRFEFKRAENCGCALAAIVVVDLCVLATKWWKMSSNDKVKVWCGGVQVFFCWYQLNERKKESEDSVSPFTWNLGNDEKAESFICLFI